MDSAIKFEKTIFEKTNEWLNYIDNLPKPQDDIDRAHLLSNILKSMKTYVTIWFLFCFFHFLY